MWRYMQAMQCVEYSVQIHALKTSATCERTECESWQKVADLTETDQQTTNTKRRIVRSQNWQEIAAQFNATVGEHWGLASKPVQNEWHIIIGIIDWTTIFQRIRILRCQVRKNALFVRSKTGHATVVTVSFIVQYAKTGEERENMPYLQTAV